MLYAADGELSIKIFNVQVFVIRSDIFKIIDIKKALA
jgi:hypothetical protein